MARHECLRQILLVIVLAGVAATRTDPLSTLAAAVLLLYFPGDVVARASGMLERWSGAAAVLLRLALSIVLAPLLLDPLWRLTQDGRVIVLTTAALLAGATVCVYRRRRDQPGALPPQRLCERSASTALLTAMAIVTSLATIGPYWPQSLSGAAPTPALIHDFIKHHALLYSLERLPLPLSSPFDAVAASDPVYYYHYFYLIPATLRAVSPRLAIELAFGLQAAFVALATAGIVYIFVKRFSNSDACATLAAALTTLVGGFDALPLLLSGHGAITLDAWNDTLVRIHNLLTQMTWTPQNVQGALIGATTALLLSERGPWWRGWLLLGPLLGAGLIGATIWVAAAFLPGVALYVLLELFLGRAAGAKLNFRRFSGAAAVGLAMLALSLPQCLGYAEMSRRHGQGLTTEWPYASTALFGRLVPPGVWANLLDLPGWLLLELGPLALFPLLLPRAVWRAVLRDPGYRFLIVSALAALLGFVTVRSHFEYNDFGQKIILAAQIAGAALAGLVLLHRAAVEAAPLTPTPRGPALSLRRRVLIGVALALGAPVGCFQAPLSAIRRHLPTDGRFAALAGGATAIAQREAAAWRFIREQTPPSAVIQTHWGTARVPFVQLARRQMGVMELERDTEVFQPINKGAHLERLAAIRAAFSETASGTQVRDALRGARVTHVLVGEIERSMWPNHAALSDAEHFEPLLRSDEVNIYLVR